MSSQTCELSAVHHLFLNQSQFFEQSRNFVSLPRTVVAEGLHQERHGPNALAEEVVDALPDLEASSGSGLKTVGKRPLMSIAYFDIFIFSANKTNSSLPKSVTI